MGEFSQLPEAQQAQHLRELAMTALPDWGFEDADLELIKIRENAVYAAKRKNGERYVVRVHRAGYHTDEALRSEFQWMRALTETGIQTPQIVPAIDGDLFKRVRHPGVPETRQVDVVAWVDGQPLGTIEEGIEADGQSLMEIFEYIGATASRMHNQVERWRLPDGFTRGAFDVDGLTGENPHWGQFWRCQYLSETERDLIQRGREQLRNDLTAFGTTSDRYSLIHADLLPENFLVGTDVTVLIDFDDSAFGWHMFDLSTPLFFHLGEPYFDSIVEAMVSGYRKHRNLPDEHLDKLLTFLVARGTTYLGWIVTRPESDTARQIGPEVAAGVVELVRNYLGETADSEEQT